MFANKICSNAFILFGLVNMNTSVNRLNNFDNAGHKFADLPNGFDGLFSVPALGLAQIFFSIGWWELKGWKQVHRTFNGIFKTLL